MKDMIFVHCLATPLDWGKNKTAEQMVKEVRKWHVNDRNWRDIGYAAVIDYEGRVAYGRDLDGDNDFYEETAAAAKGFNTRGVHVALAGGHGSEAHDSPHEHFTPKQLAALREEIRRIEAHFNKPMWVRGHNEVANKACPGFQVAEWYEKKPPRKPTQSKTLRSGSVAGGSAAVGIVGAIAQLEGNTQLVAVVILGLILMAVLFMMKDRMDHWGRGWF